MHFGTTLRLLRIDAGLSLRALAQRIGVSSAYLSRVENGLDPVPTPDRLTAIAEALDVSPTLLVDLAHQVGSVLTEYLEHVPTANALFVEIAQRNLGPADIARLRAYVEREFPPRVSTSRPTSGLRALLTPERVVLRYACGDLDELIDMAASRLATGPSVRAIASSIKARERDASTAIGEGIAVPHAVVEGAPTRAVLVTLAAPIPLATPDDIPLRVVIVLVSGCGGHDHLEHLAQVARVATHGLSEELSRAKSAREALDVISSVDERVPRRVRKAG